MLRFVLLLLCFLTLQPACPQTSRSKAKQTQTTKRSTKTTTKKKTTTAKKSAATKKTTTKKTVKSQPKNQSKSQLQNKKIATQKKRGESERQKEKLAKSIRHTLDSVMIIDNQVRAQQKSIDSLNDDIGKINQRIRRLNTEMKKLQADLEDKKQKYAKALVYMRRQKSVQQKLMFIFSAESFSQMFRRLRYIREYSLFQKAQAELIQDKQEEIKAKRKELNSTKAELQKKLKVVETKQKKLKDLKACCQRKVDYLNKNMRTVQNQIAELQREEAKLDDQIEKIIQQEIAEAQRREAEARRKREADAKRMEEKRKAEQERKLAEAKEAKRKAQEARKKAVTDAEKERAKAEVEKAEENIKAVEKAGKEEKKRIEEWAENNASEAKLSSNFAANKGRLPIPVTGAYNVTRHYGRYTVPGLSRVVLDNKGMDIRGKAGASARAIFDGEVSSIYKYGDDYFVMVRHGKYISVYSGLSSVRVNKGDRVKTREALGKIAKDKDGNYVLHFQLRNERTRLNPELWVK